MSAPSKGRWIISSNVIKRDSPTAALTTLGGHDGRIELSRQKQKEIDNVIQNQQGKAARKTMTEVKCGHEHTPMSPGSVHAQKTKKVKAQDDQATSRQRSAIMASKTKGATAICPPVPKTTKAPLPEYDDLSSDGQSNPAPMNEKIKQKKKKVEDTETIIISDSEVPDSDSDSGKPLKETTHMKSNNSLRVKSPKPSKETTPKKDKDKDKARRVESPEPKETTWKKDKGKAKARPIESPEPKETAPKKGKEKGQTPKQQVINGQMSPDVSCHMSGSRLEIPSAFTNNPQANTYYSAVSSGSITAASHAAMHALHLQILALEDSMQRMAIEEERLNLELTRSNHPMVSFPGFLLQDLYDISGPLRLLAHFWDAEASAFAGNQTLSLFSMVREAASDETAFPIPVMVATKDIPGDHRVEGSSSGREEYGKGSPNGQYEEDRGEGTSSSQCQCPATPEFEGEDYDEEDG